MAPRGETLDEVSGQNTMLPGGHRSVAPSGQRETPLLEWCAEISTECKDRLRRLSFRDSTAPRTSRGGRGATFRDLLEREWDPAKHPRGAYAENPGWFSPSGGVAGSKDFEANVDQFAWETSDCGIFSASPFDVLTRLKPRKIYIPPEDLVDKPKPYLPSSKLGDLGG